MPTVAPIATIEPEDFTAGDTLIFNKSMNDYSAQDGWQLFYYFETPDGSQSFNFTGSVTGNNTFWSVNIPAATTQAWIPGYYAGQGRIILPSTGETHQIWDGFLTIRPQLAIAADNRSKWQVIVDNIDAVLQKRATREILNSDINGVKLERIPLNQLLAIRDYFAQKVENDKVRANIRLRGGSRRNIMATIYEPGGGPGGVNWPFPPGYQLGIGSQTT